MTIAVIVAMQKELNSLSTLLTDMNQEQHNGFNYITGHMGNARLVLHQCGMGKVNAAVGASELIHNYSPDYIISSGVAGGLDPLAQIMHVVAADSVVYHDLFTGAAAEEDIERPYPCDPTLIDTARQLSQTTKHTTIHIGQICTGDQFVTELDKLLHIKHNHPEALAVDMESCAIAHTCHIYHIPFISFRIISDTIGAEHHVEEYDNFWAEMADHSFAVVKEYLEAVIKRNATH